MLDLLLKPLLGGIGLALLAGPYGCLLIWRRLPFFGDTLAHAALPAAALAVWLHIDLTLTIVAGGLFAATLLTVLERRAQVPTDTLLAVVAHCSLALGIVAISLRDGGGQDLERLLLGDLLAVQAGDLAWIAVTVLGLGGLLLAYWRPWLAIIVNEELARIEGLPVARLKLLNLFATAILIAMAMKAVGVLLVAALLILPPAAMRTHARSPEAMAIGASLIGVVSVTLGLALSWVWDSPAGPSVVLCAGVLFLISLLLPAQSSWDGRRQ